MMHKYPELTQRDRYQIGDWVLNNGKPYQWTADDYNRSRLGMKSIKPMPMSLEVIASLGMRNKCTDYAGLQIHTTYVLGERDPYNADSYIWKLSFDFYAYADGHKPQRFILNMLHNYDQHDHRFSGKVNYVHELQYAIRSVQLYDIAEGINLTQAEIDEQD